MFLFSLPQLFSPPPASLLPPILSLLSAYKNWWINALWAVSTLAINQYRAVWSFDIPQAFSFPTVDSLRKVRAMFTRSLNNTKFELCKSFLSGGKEESLRSLKPETTFKAMQSYCETENMSKGNGALVLTETLGPPLKRKSKLFFYLQLWQDACLGHAVFPLCFASVRWGTEYVGLKNSLQTLSRCHLHTVELRFEQQLPC